MTVKTASYNPNYQTLKSGIGELLPRDCGELKSKQSITLSTLLAAFRHGLQHSQKHCTTCPTWAKIVCHWASAAMYLNAWFLGQAKDGEDNLCTSYSVLDWMYTRCTSLLLSFFRHVGHFFCARIALWIHAWQKMCPQTVEVSCFIVSMQIAQLSLSSFSLGGSASTGSLRFRLCRLSTSPQQLVHQIALH
jgi:hypothetical protein